MKCEICGNEFFSRWTDTHGVGACTICGAPYTIYHYGEDNKRFEAPPKLLIKAEYLEKTKAYWNLHRRNVAPGAFNFPGSSYEVATDEDFKTSADYWAKEKMKV